MFVSSRTDSYSHATQLITTTTVLALAILTVNASGVACERHWFLCCKKSLKGEAPCGSAIQGKVNKMSPAPSPLTPSPSPSPNPLPPAQIPLWLVPPMDSMTGGRQGGQERIDDITGARDFALQLP